MEKSETSATADVVDVILVSSFIIVGLSSDKLAQLNKGSISILISLNK